MNYYYSKYNAGGTYIAAYEGEELYADVSICLAEYGIIPDENQIIIPFDDMSEDDYQMYLKDLTKTQIKEIKYGSYGATGVLVVLRDDWQTICELMR